MNTQSARNVKEFVHILSRDDQGRPTRLLVPGHGGRQYEVKLGRNGKLEASCQQVGESGTVFYADCKGASHNVCYHILAACMVAAEEQGKEVLWCADEQEAKSLAVLPDRQAFSVKSAQSGKAAWGTLQSDKPELAEAGLGKNALLELAYEETDGKRQWYTGEVVWLAGDAFLKNDDGVVRLYRVNRDKRYPQPHILRNVVYRLNPRSQEWEPQAQLTREQAETDLFDRDSAIPVQYKRGRNKLFK